MRALTSWFIDCDPIGVLKTYQERLSGKLADMETALNSLRGMRQKVAAKLKATDSELDNELRKCDLAKKAGDTRTLALEGKQVNRLQASKERYTLSMGNLDMMIAVMSRYFGLCQDTITDMGREIKWREDEREEGKQYRTVIGSAKAILQGLPEQEMWDEATEKLQSDYMAAIGEVEGFLDVTKTILSSANLQDGVDAQKAMDMLDAWQAKNSGVALGAGNNSVSKADIIAEAKGGVITGASTKPQYMTVNSGLPAAPDQAYQSMFNDIYNQDKK
jgi:hypothetical protein